MFCFFFSFFLSLVINMHIVLPLDFPRQQTDVSSVYLAECDALESCLNCYYPEYTFLQPIRMGCQRIGKDYLQRVCQERFNEA